MRDHKGMGELQKILGGEQKTDKLLRRARWLMRRSEARRAMSETPTMPGHGSRTRSRWCSSRSSQAEQFRTNYVDKVEQRYRAYRGIAELSVNEERRAGAPT